MGLVISYEGLGLIGEGGDEWYDTYKKGMHRGLAIEWRFASMWEASLQKGIEFKKNETLASRLGYHYSGKHATPTSQCGDNAGVGGCSLNMPGCSCNVAFCKVCPPGDSPARHAIVVVRGPDGDHATGAQCSDAALQPKQLRRVLRVLVLVLVLVIVVPVHGGCKRGSPAGSPPPSGSGGAGRVRVIRVIVRGARWRWQEC
ncbi:hypothetical protein BJV74DRAFT_288283 [Russula compacta]|nr:hypothetical protein BJV74DRAFT_288283 [Russula compacta]